MFSQLVYKEMCSSLNNQILGVNGLIALPWACCRCVYSTAPCKGSKTLGLKEIKHHYLICKPLQIKR